MARAGLNEAVGWVKRARWAGPGRDARRGWRANRAEGLSWGHKGKEVVQLSSDLPERTVTLEVAGR